MKSMTQRSEPVYVNHISGMKEMFVLAAECDNALSEAHKAFRQMREISGKTKEMTCGSA